MGAYNSLDWVPCYPLHPTLAYIVYRESLTRQVVYIHWESPKWAYNLAGHGREWLSALMKNHGVGGLCKIRAVWTVQPTPKSAKQRMFVANCHNTNISNYSMLTNWDDTLFKSKFQSSIFTFTYGYFDPLFSIRVHPKLSLSPILYFYFIYKYTVCMFIKGGFILCKISLRSRMISTTYMYHSHLALQLIRPWLPLDLYIAGPGLLCV